MIQNSDAIWTYQLAGRAQTPDAGPSRCSRGLSPSGILSRNLRSWRGFTALIPRHPSGEGSLGSSARIGGQPEEKGTSGYAGPCPKCGHYSLHARRRPRAERGPASRFWGLQRPLARRGLHRCFRHGLACTFLAGRVKGRMGSGVVPHRGIFGNGRRRRGSLCWGDFPGWHGVGPSRSSRAGNSTRSYLRSDRLLCPGSARCRLQPRGGAVFLGVTRVVASTLLAHPLAAREVRS
jgi:hypothetical protein